MEQPFFTFAEGLFILKLQVVCVKCFRVNSVTGSFLGILHIFSEQLLLKFSGNYFRFHQKLLLCLCFSCSMSFKKYVCTISQAHAFWYPLMKSYLMILKSQNFDFRTMLPHKKNLIKYVIKTFSCYLILNENGNKALRNRCCHIILC